MVIWPVFRMGQYRVNNHPYHAPQFIDNMNYKSFIRKLQKLLLEFARIYWRISRGHFSESDFPLLLLICVEQACNGRSPGVR